MKELNFGNGRIFDCGFDMKYPCDDEKGLKTYILDMYPYLGMKNYELMHKKLELTENNSKMDEESLVECLFLDVEEYGEKKILDAIERFEIALACASAGVPCVGGPLPWE